MKTIFVKSTAPQFGNHQPFPLVAGPTPLQRLEAFKPLPDNINIYVKRDDLTGFAGGGNKARKLEYLVADAMRQGADVILTVGAVQSNHTRATAAAARVAGLDCEVFLVDRVPVKTDAYRKSGNVLLNRLLGAACHFCSTPEAAEDQINARMQQFITDGRKPFLIPVGGSNAVGALGYMACADELARQAAALDIQIDHVVAATGSAGTHAGLLAGFAAAGLNPVIHGVSVYNPNTAEVIAAVERLGADSLDEAGVKHVSLGDIIVHDRFLGDGYGLPTEETLSAMQYAARHYGLLLDPVYSGKSMAGFLSLCRDGIFEKGSTVIFLHTGGLPGLFGYQHLFEKD